MDDWLNELDKRGLFDKVYILAGVTPLKSLKMARFMHNEVPGVVIPQPLLQRMEQAESAGNAAEEGVQIALELIEKIKAKPGISGLHLMAVGWEEIVPRIVNEAGLAKTNR